MAVVRVYSNDAVYTTLQAQLSAGGSETTITVGDTTNWPTPAGGQVALGCISFGTPANTEIFSYTGKTSTTFTGVTRGIDGTTKPLQAVGAAVRHVASSEDIENAARINTENTFTSQQIISATSYANLFRLNADGSGLGLVNSDNTRHVQWGTGSPEGAVTGSIGSIFLRKDGSSGTTVYAKTSGTGNTGWEPVGGGGRVLSAVAYDPGTAVTKSTATLIAMTAMDTTNLRLTFTAPASGRVRIRFRGAWDPGSATEPASIFLGVLDGSTVKMRVAANIGGFEGSPSFVGFWAEGVVTGLTGGTSYTYDAAYGVEETGSSSAIWYGGPNDATINNAGGAFVYEVSEA